MKKIEVRYNNLREATKMLDELNMPWVYDAQTKSLYTKEK